MQHWLKILFLCKNNWQHVLSINLTETLHFEVHKVYSLLYKVTDKIEGKVREFP